MTSNKMVSNKTILAYCAVSMGMTMLSRGFNFYYVKVFLNRYNIQESWFHFSQVLYMVWNAVNDPLFAILQDNTSFLLTRTRREGILYTAPFFALSFLVPWFQFGESSWAVGLHLIVALFLWDTMFTFVGLLCCCLFTEFSADPHTRLKLTRYSTIASLIGAQCIFFLEYASDSLQDFRAFQIAAVCVACCSCLLMVYTGLNAHTQYDLPRQDSSDDLKQAEKGEEADSGFLKQMWQLFSERNFVSFVITNFFQMFHRAFLGGFTAILCEYLVPAEQVATGIRSIFYGLSGPCGGILVIFGTPLVGRLGYFRVIRYSFVWKIAGGMIMYFLVGPSNPWLVMLFILLDSSFSSAAFTLFNMPLSDIADDDKQKYHRRKPISSTVFGSNALVVKPAQSLSPMLVVGILNRYGYEQVKKGSASDTEMDVIKAVMFQFLCFYPVVLGIVQYISWSQFAIRRKIVEVHVAEEKMC
ncbi:hypothetical protein V1264_011692 [Littorina saxatilis]|uniref:Transmembrane protein 180 n=1 Tax=Littorina saxatilis TaxID=31220 RepID=A0AAN9BUR9_9CAEN